MCPLLIFLFICGGVESIRPRGVRVELASFYNPADEFSCLDGSGTIPFIQVNDDYCDCDVKYLVFTFILYNFTLESDSFPRDQRRSPLRTSLSRYETKITKIFLS